MKYMKVLYISNYPSPYRVDFFNLLGQKVDLTVSFTERPEEQRHRAKAWFHTNYDHFKAVFLKKFFVSIENQRKSVFPREDERADCTRSERFLVGFQKVTPRDIAPLSSF